MADAMKKYIDGVKKKKSDLMTAQDMDSFRASLIQKQEDDRPKLADTMTEEEKKRMIREFMGRVK